MFRARIPFKIKEKTTPMSEPTDAQPQEKERPQPDRKADAVLRNLSFACNRANFAIPITISVKGQLVTGSMISRERYIQEMQEQYINPFLTSWDHDEDSKKVVAGWLDVSFGPPEPMEPDSFPEEINFIHLADAHVYTGGNGLPTNQGILWRSPLDSVDGFFWGTLEPANKK